MNMVILTVAALLPAIVLCGYVFKKDKVEKEPVGLLLKLLLFGALCCYPAAEIEMFLSDILDAVFSYETLTLLQAGNVSDYTAGVYGYILAENFVVVALVEEVCKFIVLLWLTRKNKEFNSLFDGLIYSVFVSLGFAALENVLYVFDGGIMVAVLRAVLAVPGHMFYAVIMGYYYSLWHIKDKAATLEEKLKENSIIEDVTMPFDSKNEKIKCLLIPILAHGFYDVCCSVGTDVSMLVLIVFVIFMYIHCFKKIKTMSKVDAYENAYVEYMLENKYPALKAENYLEF